MTDTPTLEELLRGWTPLPETEDEAAGWSKGGAMIVHWPGNPKPYTAWCEPGKDWPSASTHPTLRDALLALETP